MNAPPSTVQGRTGKPRKIKQYRPIVASAVLPQYTPSLYSGYLGTEGKKVETLGQLQSIGQYAAYAPHRLVTPIRKVNEDPVMQPRHAYMLRPNLGPSVYTAKALHFTDPLAMQYKTRYNKGNVDWKQAPLWTGFNESKLI